MQCPLCKCKKATNKLWRVKPNKVFHCQQCNAPLKVRARELNRFKRKVFETSSYCGIPLVLLCIMVVLSSPLWFEAGVFLMLGIIYNVAFTRMALPWVLKYDPA